MPGAIVQRSIAGNATAEITRGKVIVKDNGTTVKKVLTVDANETDKSTADRGSVYIRKGIVELESSYGTKLTDAQVQAQATSGNDKGYVRADRFVSNRGWTNPITGGVVSSFNRGTTYAIRCAFDGIVRMAKTYAAYGNVVVVRHDNGLESIYSHNSRNLVKSGDIVKAGDAVGLTGRTGRATTEHLHLEFRIDGQHFNPNLIFDMKDRTLHKTEIVCTKAGNRVIVKQNLTPKK